MQPVIIVFAKAPVAGEVKTRLQLPPAQAAALHVAFVNDTLAMLRTIPNVDVELHTDIATDAWAAAKVPSRLQCEGNLGLRMFNALHAALTAGHPQAMIVGSDAPDLPTSHIQTLLDSTERVAIGPCDDGGYYAIACRRVKPEMFDDVTWSEADAFEETVQAATRCGLPVEVGPRWHDVDTPEDLQRLRNSPALPPYTRAVLLAVR